MDIRIVDTIFDPNVYGTDQNPDILRKRSARFNQMDFNVYYYEQGKEYVYKVWLFLSGTALPFVNEVTYQLPHSLFNDPNRTVNRSPVNPDCRLVIWTRKIFSFKATIYDKNGHLYTLPHRLNYANLLEKFKGKINYIGEDPEASSGATLVP